MKYSKSKIGYIVIIETLDSRARTIRNVIVDYTLNNLRKRVGDFILNQIKKMKPEKQMVSWNTKLGTFTILKETRYSNGNSWDLWKSRYLVIETKLEYPYKDTYKMLVLKSRKIPNKDSEDYDQCPSCSSNGLLIYEIKRQDEELIVCKKCYDFDKILDKLDKKQKLTESEIRSLTH